MKALRALAGAAALAAATVAPFAIETASAAPTGCTAWYTDLSTFTHGVKAHCSGGTGYVRAGAVCNGVLRYGAYVAVPGPDASIYCPTNVYPTSKTYTYY